VSAASGTPKTVPCPNCGKLVRWEPASRYRPFCSERCKLIDLGDWATERYRIPDENPQENTDPSGAPPA